MRKSYKYFEHLFLLILFILPTMQNSVSAQTIRIQDAKLYCDSLEIFLLGANTPWDSWNDFGGNYNPQFWEQEFARMKASGLNSSRIWISCDGDGQPYVGNNGYAHSPTQAFWEHMDHLMLHAQKHGIYIMATISSFDHFDKAKPNHEGWRTMISQAKTIESYTTNFVIPLVNRYKSNPYFFSIDICNEPEWIHENPKCGNLPWEHIQLFAGMCAAAIHKQQTHVLVSIGSAAVKWGSSVYEGNLWSDKALQEITGDSLAYMDYWHIHYYGWINKHFSNPFTKSPADYDLHDKPCIIGETPGLNTIYEFPISYFEIFHKPYILGYSGVYPWTSNGAGEGDFGNLNTFGPAALEFLEKKQTKK